MNNKRGLSPVIATMLLVSLALVLAVIIFFWARSFIGESISKQGSAIQLLCDDVTFDVEVSNTAVRIENLGDVPIYGVEVRKIGFGDVSYVQAPSGVETITAGQTKNFPFDSSPGLTVDVDKVLVIPILLGEGDGATKSHTCDEDYGIEVTVSA